MSFAEPSWQLDREWSCNVHVSTARLSKISIYPISRPIRYLRVNHATYNAYCIAPFFPSWLGNGTSRRAFFIGGGAGGPSATNPGLCVCVAGFEDVLERKAADPARKGSRAVEGLAV